VGGLRAVGAAAVFRGVSRGEGREGGREGGREEFYISIVFILHWHQTHLPPSLPSLPSKRYPIEPPRVEFVPPLFHPLVCADDGHFSPEALPGQDERGRKAGTGTMPTIRKMLLALIDPLKGSLANPKADMRHIVHADATYAVLHPPEEDEDEGGREGGSIFRREARVAHEEGRGRMMGVVRELYDRFGATLAGEEKVLVERTLGLGEGGREGGREGEGMMLVATLRVLEQHANECLLEED